MIRQTHIAHLIAAALLAALVAPQAPAAEPRPVWLVVTRPMFAGALKPLAAHRRTDGFETVVSTESPDRALAKLKAAGKRPAMILLVGDARKAMDSQPWHVATRWANQYHWRTRGKVTFAADPLWGDLDGDSVPDVPVGRIPARTAAEVKTVVDKTLAFEGKTLGPDDLRLPVWAGSPAYHPVIDSLATGLLATTVSSLAPPWANTWLISGDANHPLCGWPADQTALFTKQLKRDRVMALMIGHGSVTSFFSMRHSSGSIYYRTRDTAALATGPPRSPMIILTCSSGKFTSGTCLTKSLLLQPGGPVAAIGAAAQSHPLPNYFTGAGLLKALNGKCRRIGPLWLEAQKHMLVDRNLLVEKMLLSAEGNIQRAGLDHRKLRADQIMLYALLGDPAARVFLPDRLRGRIDWKGAACHWQVRKPAGATRLYVSFRPAGQTGAGKTGQAADRAEALKRHAQANAAYAFTPVAQLGPDAPWKGTIAKEGTLRLIATGRGQIHAAAIGIKRPADK